MFELDKVTARITSYNSRGETHGESIVPAGDIGMEIKTDNGVLTYFGSQLRGALYAKNASRDTQPKDQGELDVAPPVVADLPHLKNPAIVMPLKLVYEGVGYTLNVDYGLGEKSAIILGECKVADISVDCQEGGTVVMRLRVSKSDMPEKARAILSGMVKRDITISLTPPDAGQGKLAA